MTDKRRLPYSLGIFHDLKFVAIMCRRILPIPFMAGATVASISVLIFYAIFQRQILKRIMLTGLKG